jgi:hypothetical protein
MNFSQRVAADVWRLKIKGKTAPPDVGGYNGIPRGA